MFTGIVSEVGSVVEVHETDSGRSFLIGAPRTATGIEDGQSIAINGACLTAFPAANGSFRVDAVAETLGRSNLGGLVVGDSVNLERPVALEGLLDGHLMQGHVDALGEVVSLGHEGEAVRMRVTVAPELLRYVTEKGSVALDGVSLTVTAVDQGGFEVVLIPHTLSSTTLGLRRGGSVVNVEVDVIAKYVERLLEARS